MTICSRRRLDRVLERPRPASEIVVEDLDDDLCLYRPDIDEVLVLNHTAGDVWRLADGQLRVAEIVERLAGVYTIDSADSADLAGSADIGNDVHRVIEDLETRGYLVDATAESGES